MKPSINMSFDSDGLVDVTVMCHPRDEQKANQIIDDIKAGKTVVLGKGEV
jgi:hypothetical protein